MFEGLNPLGARGFSVSLHAFRVCVGSVLVLKLPRAAHGCIWGSVKQQLHQ